MLGGGFAGLTAALSAAEWGARVTVVEKSARIGGSAVLSNGMLVTYGDFNRFRTSAPDGNEVLQELVHQTFAESARWLASHGAELAPQPRQLDRYDGWQIDPLGCVSTLATRVTEHGGTIRLESSLDSLRVVDGRVVGASVVGADGAAHEISADAVVLSTGGFQGSPELLARFACLDAANLSHRSNPWSTGDGLSAAIAVGAGTSVGLGGLYGHALPAPPARITSATFAELSQYYGSRAVALNLRGRRFVDETTGGFEENVNEALARQPRGLGFYVFDEAIAHEPAADGLPLTPAVAATRVHEAGGRVVRGETLTELADRLGEFGVPVAVAKHTLTDVAAAATEGRPERLEVPRSGLTGTALAAGPYTAVFVKASITFTTGGLAVDDNMAVLRRSRSSAPEAVHWLTDALDFRADSIPGLFAAGCDIGGVSNVGYAGGLATALTTGRVAGRQAAAMAV